MAKVNRYKKTGFACLDEINSGDLQTAKAAAVNIVKGDVLHNAAGYATNGVIAFTHELLGVAIADVDNSAGGAGDLDVQFVKALVNKRFIAPVLAAAKVTQASVGVLIDLEACNTVDVGDVVTLNPGLRVEEIDISAEAIAANAFGYVIGRFQVDS